MDENENKTIILKNKYVKCYEVIRRTDQIASEDEILITADTDDSICASKEWSAKPCKNFDECPIKNKSLHCYSNKPCFQHYKKTLI